MKKKYLMGVFACAGVLLFTSCSTGISSIESENYIYPTNQVSGTETNSSISNKPLLYDPVYESTVVDLNTVDSASAKTSVEETVEKVYDSVVSITATSVSSIGAGSGVLFAHDDTLGLSYIVTCFHVVKGYSSYEVTLSNGETYTAQYVGGYQDDDLAILSIEKTNLTYASIYTNSDSLKLGSTVVAIGNPLGTLPGSVSSGVVSYVNRVVQTDDYKYQTLLQTDVAINSGNSGGGLFNTSSALIGIVNAKYSASGIEGLSFAVPSKYVLSTIEELLATAKYDTANKVWDSGYVRGDYEYGFTISLGVYQSGTGWNRTQSYVYYVSDVESNSTYTGTELKKSDIVKSIKVDYSDEAKEDYVYTVSTKEDVNEWLYSLDLDLDDNLYFTVTRDNQEETILVDVCQFIYSI